MSRLLLINPDKKLCSDIKFLLHLNGYQIESCDTVDEGINRYQIFQELDQGFDLALIVADNELLTELEQIEENPLFDKLIVIHEKRDREQSKSAAFSKLAMCDPKLVLDCVKYHLKRTRSEVGTETGHKTGWYHSQNPAPNSGDQQ
jgi:hypothetical protein